MRRRRQLGAWLVVAACALVAGCDPFEEIKPGSCGNRIVEPDRGEDCDGFKLLDMNCRGPGELACRFACTPTVPGAIEEADAGAGGAGGEGGAGGGDGGVLKCAPGWGCGADGVCRRSRGTFETLDTPVQETASLLAPGDFDGDGRTDLLSVSTAGLSVHFFDQGGTYARRIDVPAVGTVPAIGDLNADGVDDFTMNVSLGLGVQRGQTTRELDSVVFPIYTAGANVRGLRYLPVAFGKDAKEDFALQRDDQDLWSLFHQGQAGALSQRSITDTAVARAAPSQYPCDKIAIAYENGEPQIEIHSPCNLAGESVLPPNEPLGFPRTVNLAGAGYAPRRVFFDDVDGNGTLDLVISAVRKTPPSAEIHVAYGQADGSYGDAPASSNGVTAQPYAGISGELLAVGNLDGDADADFVTSDGVYIVEGAQQKRVVENVFAPWTDAVIGDFNGNDVLDVLAAHDTSPNLDFYSGVDVDSAGGELIYNVFRVPTDGGAEHLAAGDFDGDTLRDVAFAEVPLSLTGMKLPERTLRVSFGRALASPEPPVSLGRFPEGIEQVVTFMQPSSDALTDLGVVARRRTGETKMPAWTISVLQGSGDRQLQAPLFLRGTDQMQVPPQPYVDVPLRSYVGRFDDGISRDKSRDLVLITNRVRDTISEERHVWRVPVQGDAFVNPNALGDPVALPGLASDPGKLNLIDGVVADLDEEEQPLDELVLSLPLGLENGTSMGSGIFVTRPSQGASMAMPVPQFAKPGVLYVGLRAGDIDGDGNVDIAAVQVTVAKNMGDKDEFIPTPIVFWGDGKGGLSEPSMAAAPGPEVRCVSRGPRSLFKPLSLAIVEAGTENEDPNADPDPVKSVVRELVLVDPGGAYLVSLDKDPAQGNQMRKLGTPRCLRGIPGGNVVSAADHTGDGVDDLVIGATGSTYLVRGIPRRP